MQAHEHVAGDFLPHGFCYLWDPQLLWTHVAADFLIGAAYVTISISLAWLVHRVRNDIPFSWAFVAFGLFIITCGMTHFMDIWTLWRPDYWLSGSVKVVTAVASVTTAIAMPFTVPRAVATVRDARRARERELAETRAAALEEQNDVLRAQAAELEERRAEAQALAEQVGRTNAALRDALADAERERLAAEEANYAKSVFLRTMSHELRTPLNAVIGYAQLMDLGISGPVSPQQREQLGRINRSAAHLLGLIDEVLTLTSAPEGSRVIGPVAVRPAVADVVMMCTPQAAAKGIELRVGDLPDAAVRAEPQWLRQILVNLTVNAIKFTDHGHVALSGAVEKDAFVLRVEDTGIGIAAEHREDVFLPFWQVDQDTTRAHGGTGLGLAVSRELAGRMGARIELDSRAGGGSTFTLRLPLDTAA
jgi:signal transduction histidine kinase